MDHRYTDPLIDPEIFISNVSKTAKESFCFDLLLASVPVKVSYIYIGIKYITKTNIKVYFDKLIYYSYILRFSY